MKCLNSKCVVAYALRVTAITTMLFGYQAQASCQYTLTSQWANGFQAEMTVVNDSLEHEQDWLLTWSWENDIALDYAWGADINCNGNTCSAHRPAWMPPLAVGQQHTFRFIGKKADEAVQPPSIIRLYGGVCSDEKIKTPESSLWVLDGVNSSLQYVSVKNHHTAEVNDFGSPTVPALQGSIEPNGRSVIAIDLNKVFTGIGIRDSRMRLFVFETELLPIAYLTATVDTASIFALAVGDSQVMTVASELSVHGVRQTIQYDALVVKRSETQVDVSSLAPIVIDSKQFDMANGISVLREVGNLSAIGEAVPVYFQLRFDLVAEGASPITMPNTPAAPLSLSGDFDVASARATLAWNDNGMNENNFLVRRKTPLGLWSTVTTLDANQIAYQESLPSKGVFDYKIIAVNQSMPSSPSNTVRVKVTDGDPIARGMQVYEASCAGCHASDGSGVGGFPPVNIPRDFDALSDDIEATMPPNNPKACDAACSSDVSAYIKTL